MHGSIDAFRTHREDLLRRISRSAVCLPGSQLLIGLAAGTAVAWLALRAGSAGTVARLRAELDAERRSAAEKVGGEGREADRDLQPIVAEVRERIARLAGLRPRR